MVVRILSIVWIAVCLSGTIVPGGPDLSHGNADPVVLLLEPNGGNVLHPGMTAPIRWQTESIPPGDKMVLILYDRGIKALTISRGCPNTGKYEWNIPRSMKDGNQFRVRIRWIRNPAVNDFSDRDFSILSDSP